MGANIFGSGPVRDYQGHQTGTYTANSSGTGFHYDDDPQGPGGNDKDWSFSAGTGKYYYPPNPGPNGELCISEFFSVGFDEQGVPNAWWWKEWCRGSVNDPFPIQPTAEGSCQRS